MASRIAVLEKALEDAQRTIDEWRSRHDKLEKQYGGLVFKVDDLNDRIKTLELKLKKSDESLYSSQRQLDYVRQEYEREEKQRKAADELIKTTTAKNEQLAKDNWILTRINKILNRRLSQALNGAHLDNQPSPQEKQVDDKNAPG